jgi:hypothetical protein
VRHVRDSTRLRGVGNRTDAAEQLQDDPQPDDYELVFNRNPQLRTELEEAAERSYVAPLAFAFAYVGLGDDRAFEWLDKAIEARNPVVTHLPSMPLYDNIRRDHRFQALLAKMRLA